MLASLIVCFTILYGTFGQGNGDDFKCGLEGSCVFGVCDATKCADSDCSARESNIQGDLVLLDVNSQSYNAGPNHPPQVTNPADCCDQCKQTSGCNAWVFCSNENGCGTGCSEYVDSLTDSSKGFGQFGGCNGDKWPWLMCSLKSVSDISNIDEQGAEDGWVSGVVETSATCEQGPSYALCNACEQSADPTFCNQCASTVYYSRDNLLCATCADLSTSELKNHCSDCLSSDYGSIDGCGRCAIFGDGAQQCFECAVSESEIEAQRGCVGCSQSSNQEECISTCVKSDSTPLFAKAECGDCYSDSTDPIRCVQCLQSSQEADTECPDCTTEECFNCLSLYPTSVDGRRGCTNCAQQLGSDPQSLSDCYACTTNQNVPLGSKLYCGFCSSYRDDSATKQACYGCLESNSGEVASDCSNCLRYGKDPDRCYECVGKLNPGGFAGASGCWDCAELDTAEERSACYECAEDPDKPIDVANTCNMCFIGDINTQPCLECYKTTTFQDKEECWSL